MGVLTRAAFAVLALMLLPAIALAQRQAERSWWDRAPALWSQYYLIKTDLPKVEARAYASHLDRMYEEYSRRLASLPPRAPEKLNVFIFQRPEEYLLTMRTRWGIDARGSGGMFFTTSSGGGLAFFTDALPTRRIHHVIQHEGFHQFAYSRFGGDLPIWVNEGLAEFFGRAILVGDRFVLGQSSTRVIEGVSSAIELDQYIPFLDMLTMTDAQWSRRVKDGSASMLYNQAWSMVQFLVYGDNERYQQHFERYLRLLNNGVTSEQAFVQVFGNDIAAFERRWKENARAARPSAFVTALERIEFLAEGVLALSKKGIVPESLEELKTQLQQINFTHTIGHHGLSATLSASDDVNFTIPMDDLTPKQPVFIVEKPNLRRLPIRQRKMEEKQPTPSAISTENLHPRGLSVRWNRDKETGDIHYDITVR